MNALDSEIVWITLAVPEVSVTDFYVGFGRLVVTFILKVVIVSFIKEPTNLLQLPKLFGQHEGNYTLYSC